MDIESNLGALIINLSYQDIISFLKCYLLNKILIQKIRALNKKESIENNQKQNNNLEQKNSVLNSVTTIIDSQKNSFIKIKLTLNNIFFTLIDNSSGSYQPFISGELNKISLNYNRTNSLEFSYEFLLSSYNYIARVLEPILENMSLNLKYDFSFESKNSQNIADIDIKEVNMNLSDMAISSTLIIFQNWSEKFIKDEKEYSRIKVVSYNNNNKIKIGAKNSKKDEIISKISNASVINYSGIDLKIKYNKKEYKIIPNSKLDIEYILNWNNDELDLKQITVMMDNINKIEFKISIDKLGTTEYKLDQNFPLIAENTLTKDRHINITIYSPIIIKNKTFNNIQVKFMNSKSGNYFNLLKPNEIVGIKTEFYNEHTLFIFNIMGKDEQYSNIKFHLKDIIENNEFYQNLFLGGKFFYIKLIKKLNNLKEILITFQYSIVNGLPCDLIMENQKENKSILIKKFTQYFVDFYTDMDTELVFKIKIGEEYFYSLKTKYFKMNLKRDDGNNYYTDFSNKNKTKIIRLALQYNKTKSTKLLIFYSESFFYNYSGVDFNIISQNGDNPFLFYVGNKLYLISSKIDNINNAWIQLRNNRFVSNRILLDDIIQASPCYKLKLFNNEYSLNLSITKQMSYIAIRNNPNFKENIMTMIYKIYPFCRITNLLTSRNLFIGDESDKNNSIIINSFRETCFNFFDKGKNITLLIGLLDLDNRKCGPRIKFKFSSLGIFTFCIENIIFNIEVKESNISKVYDIFVVESNFDNAKVVVENLTNSNFIITQEGYEDFRQILSQNEKQILKIYDQNYNYFIIKDSQMNQTYRFSFSSFKKEQYTKEINNLIFIKESNGMKMKLTIINKENFSTINNTLMNIGIKLRIDQIFISIICDNEYKDKKLRNYERHELSLIHVNKAIINFNLEHYSGLLDNDKIIFKFLLGNLSVYNQISKYGKYSVVFKNISEQMCFMESEIINYKNSSMSYINQFKLNTAKLKLNIDPNFIEEIINFGKNMLYRMEIINFNVDDIFLHSDRNEKTKKRCENYLKENSLYFGINFIFPEIDVTFELNDLGLNELLKEKMKAPQYLIWLGSGLVGKEHNIFLKIPILNSHLGSMKSLIEKIISMYKDASSMETNKIGFKGFIGRIQQFFIPNKTNKNCTEVQKKRIRHPRAFYGEYKYYKKYEENDAIYFEIIEQKYNLSKGGIYLSDFILGEKYLYTFTKDFLLILEKDTLKKYGSVYYSLIDRVIFDKSYVIVYFNEKIKRENKAENITLNCESEFNAECIQKLLNEKSKIILP